MTGLSTAFHLSEHAQEDIVVLDARGISEGTYYPCYGTAPLQRFAGKCVPLVTSFTNMSCIPHRRYRKKCGPSLGFDGLHYTAFQGGH
jgi:hypothetical protein